MTKIFAKNKYEKLMGVTEKPAKTELAQAISVLAKALKEDPEYRYSWQANIAMAFVDEYDRTENKWGDVTNVRDVANKAASNFLDILCLEVK